MEMEIKELILVVFILSLVCLSTVALDCKKIDNCSCRLKNGKIVTTKPLAKKDGSPLFLDVKADDGFYYSYNPCYTFDESDCHKSAVCQRTSKNGTAKSIVDQGNVEFGQITKNEVQITYLSSGGIPRQVMVSYVCVENLSPPKIKAYGFQNDTKKYMFQVFSNCACPNACYSEPSEGLSAGSVILIVFFVMVAVYLIGGTIYGRVVKQKGGLEMLPNYEFWVAFPTLVKNGCFYAVRCTCCRPSEKKYEDL